MLQRPSVTQVLVQGDYMSGDRYAIASALKLDNQLGVVVLAAAGHAATAREMKSLYDTAAGGRVEICELPLVRGRSAEQVVSDAYARVKTYADQIVTWINGGRRGGAPTVPAFLNAHVGHGVKVFAATRGTQIIADKFAHDGGRARNELRRYWGLGADTSAVVRDLIAWVADRGFSSARRYVVLFAKAGDRHAEKAHHFTSILTWRILQERVERETTVLPVAMGDDIGLRTRPSLVKFWDDAGWKKLLSGRGLDPRRAQLGFWCFMAEHFPGLSIVGMRSGAIEVPALLGIRTLYLEEAHNQQAARMAKWLGPVTGYQREIVSRPPGIAQQKYWHADATKPGRPAPLRSNATTKGSHLTGVVTGFSKSAMKPNYHVEQDWHDKVDPSKPSTDTGREREITEKQGLVHRVFGTGGLGSGVSAADFMLQSSEFDRIVNWIGATPSAARGGAAVSTSYPMQTVASETRKELRAKRHDETWSAYFASDEYRAYLAKLPTP